MVCSMIKSYMQLKAPHKGIINRTLHFPKGHPLLKTPKIRHKGGVTGKSVAGKGEQSISVKCALYDLRMDEERSIP